jgi:UDP-glucose 4-epimerase
MTESRTAVVTGASGAVGPALVRELLRSDYQVRIMSRSKPTAGLVPEGVEWMRGDVAQLECVRAACQGGALLFHLAARLHETRSSRSAAEEYTRVNVQGTANVLAAAQDARMQRVVVFSTISVYGATHGRIVDEETPINPDTIYAGTKAAAETHALAARRWDGRPLAVVLRLASVYGPHMKGNYARLVHALRHRRFLPVGCGANRRTLVFDADAAAAALLAATHPAAGGTIFNVTDGGVHQFSRIVEAICAALGRRPPRWSLPERPVRAVLAGMEHALRPAGIRLSLDVTTLDKLLEDTAVRGERIRRRLGFQPRFDLVTGWQTALRGVPEYGALKSARAGVGR